MLTTENTKRETRVAGYIPEIADTPSTKELQCLYPPKVLTQRQQRSLPATAEAPATPQPKLRPLMTDKSDHASMFHFLLRIRLQTSSKSQSIQPP